MQDKDVFEIIDDFGYNYLGELVSRENKVVTLNGEKIAYLPPRPGEVLQSIVGLPDEKWEEVRAFCEKKMGHPVLLPYPFDPQAIEQFLASQNGDQQYIEDLSEEEDQ